EVPVGELVPLPAVVQRLGPVEVVHALLEVPERLVDGRDVLLDVHVDATERVGDLLEPAEVDQYDVVDTYPRETLDGLHGERHATPCEGRIDLGLGVAQVGVGRALRDVHVQVARNRDQVRLLVVRLDVQQD